MNCRVPLKTFFLAMLAFSLLISSQPKFVLASLQQRLPGVNAGDWAKYGNITVTWSSNDPKAKPEQALIIANQTSWFSHTVTEIDNTVIRFRNVTHLENGTESVNTLWIDVDLGWGNGSLMFISAALHAGDTLYERLDPEEPLVYINSTQFRTYLGVARETHHLNFTVSYRVETDPPQIIWTSINHYWDKITGILTERRASYINKTGDYTTSSFKSDIIVETNLWLPDTTLPNADAGSDQTVNRYDEVRFDGSSSTDNVRIVSYEWDFGDGAKDTGITTTHVYTAPGTYSVTLTVRDSAYLQDTDWITITVEEAEAGGFPYWMLGAAVIAVVGGLVFYQRRRTRFRRRRRRLRRETHK